MDFNKNNFRTRKIAKRNLHYHRREKHSRTSLARLSRHAIKTSISRK